MTRISDLVALAGNDVVPADDLLTIVDVSEATPADRNKKITIANLFTALRESVDDRVAALLFEGSNITIAYDDGAGTITISASVAPGDITGLNEAIDDRVAALLQEGTNVTLTYNDGAGTLEIAAAGGSTTFATGAELRTGTEAAKALSPDTVWDAADLVALNDSGGNIAVDLSTGLNFSMTMDGDYTLSNPTNAKPGQEGIIVLTQDGTGTQTLAYGANWKFAGGTDPVLSTAASSVDVLFYKVISSSVIIASLSKAFA